MDGFDPTTGTAGGSGNPNVFLQSLQQLGQYLASQNQGTGSGLSLGSGGMPQGPGFNLGSGQMPSKVVTQVHYATPETSTDQANAQPAVSTPPPAPQVSTFAPPGGGSQPAIAQPNMAVGAQQAQYRPNQAAAQPGAQTGAIDNLGTLGDESLANEAINGRPSTGPGSGQPTSNAISGITSALSKGLTDAASAIGNVKTMPTPIQSGPFPSINQYAPTLIGRRTQPRPAY